MAAFTVLCIGVLVLYSLGGVLLFRCVMLVNLAAPPLLHGAFHDIGMENGRLWLPPLLLSFSKSGFLVPRRSSAEAAIVLFLYAAAYFGIGVVTLLATLLLHAYLLGSVATVALGPIVAWVLLLWTTAIWWVRDFFHQSSLKEVPHVRWRSDYAATTLKYFGVEDLDNLAYFEDIIDDTVVQPDEETNICQYWLLDCNPTREGLIWSPGKVTSGSNFGYVVPSDSSVYYRLALRGVENCTLLRVGLGLLLFWLTSFGLLMGHLPGVLLLGTAFAIVRAVVVYLYCRRVISTFRMSPSHPSYGPLPTRLAGQSLLRLRLLQGLGGSLLLALYLCLLLAAEAELSAVPLSVVLYAGLLALAASWTLMAAIPQALDKQRLALGYGAQGGTERDAG
eukprot:EG_transcript_15628